MRFTILLTLCVLGVASASSLTKRDDNHGLPKLGNVNAGSLLSSIFDPKKLQEQLTTVLVNAMAGRNKRDVREDIQNFLADAQAKAKDAGGNLLKDARVKLMQAVQQFLKDAQTKAANVGAEVQKAIDQLFAVAEKKVEESQNVVKRDVREEIQSFLKEEAAKAKDAGGNFLKDARAKLMQAVQQFLKDAQTKAANVGVEVQKVIDQLFAKAEAKVDAVAGESNVAKRDVREQIQTFLQEEAAKAKGAGENFLKDARAKVMSALQKFLADAQNKTQNVGAEIQKAIDSFFAKAEAKVAGSAEAQEVVKRDVREQIQNFLADAQAKAKDAGGNFLKDARAKLMQAVQQFLKDAQTKTANVGVEVQKAIDNFFEMAEKKVEENSAQAA